MRFQPARVTLEFFSFFPGNYKVVIIQLFLLFLRIQLTFTSKNLSGSCLKALTIMHTHTYTHTHTHTHTLSLSHSHTWLKMQGLLLFLQSIARSPHYSQYETRQSFTITAQQLANISHLESVEVSLCTAAHPTGALFGNLSISTSFSSSVASHSSSETAVSYSSTSRSQTYLSSGTESSSSSPSTFSSTVSSIEVTTNTTNSTNLFTLATSESGSSSSTSTPLSSFHRQHTIFIRSLL